MAQDKTRERLQRQAENLTLELHKATNRINELEEELATKNADAIVLDVQLKAIRERLKGM